MKNSYVEKNINFQKREQKNCLLRI